MWPDFWKPFQIVHPWISKNTDLKYKMYYRLLMLDSSNVRFVTMLSDTGNRVVCTVGQTYGHSSPDHTTRRADVEWNSLGPQATLLMHPSGPTGSAEWLHRVGKKLSVKEDLLIYNHQWHDKIKRIVKE